LVLWFEINGKIIIVGVSIKEGETIKWNEKVFEVITNEQMNKGLTLHYWYNKDKIKSFSIGLRNPKGEAELLALLLGIPVRKIPILGIISILLNILLFSNLIDISTLAISVSVVYKNGDVVSSTAFYGNNYRLLNVITIHGYGYGAWSNIRYEDWKNHP